MKSALSKFTSTAIFAGSVIAGGMITLSASAYEAGDIIVKGGVATVAPTVDSGKLWTDVTGSLNNSEVDVDNDTQLGISATYMIDSHLGLEVLGSTPFQHEVKVQSSDLGGALDGLSVGTAKHLPPTVSMQYFFAEPQAKYQPYVGAGVTYVGFFDETLSAAAKSTLGATDLHLSGSLGFAFQTGIDYLLTDHILVNGSVMYANVQTQAKIKADGTDALGAGIKDIRVSTDIDPYVYRINVGYKF